jgi:hypothetical protein
MNRNQRQLSYTERSESMSHLALNPEIRRGIERWENEGGRIRMETTASDGLNRSTDQHFGDHVGKRREQPASRHRTPTQHEMIESG